MDISNLDYIQFYVTTKCNLACPFCFNRGISFKSDINLKDYRYILSTLAGVGVKNIDILGGEPTLHDGLHEILRINDATGMITYVSTNGNNIAFLEHTELHCRYSSVRFGISLYPQLMKKEVLDFIVKHSPAVKSICTRKDFIHGEGQWVLDNSDAEYHLIFMDVLNMHDLDLALSFPEYFSRLRSARDQHDNVYGVFCSGFLPDTGKYPILDDVRCPAGTTKVSVLPDGSVYPCYLLFRYKRFRLGNLLFDDIHEILNSPVLDTFRLFKKNNCINRTCEFHAKCHGGCPAVSLSVYGDLSAPEPRCYKKV